MLRSTAKIIMGKNTTGSAAPCEPVVCVSPRSDGERSSVASTATPCGTHPLGSRAASETWSVPCTPTPQPQPKCMSAPGRTESSSKECILALQAVVAPTPVQPAHPPTSQVPPPPGLHAEAALPLPFVGSAVHDNGKCKPYAWFWKPQGCQNGQLCLHCHLCPAGEHKACRKTRLAALSIEIVSTDVSANSDLLPLRGVSDAPSSPGGAGRSAVERSLPPSRAGDLPPGLMMGAPPDLSTDALSHRRPCALPGLATDAPPRLQANAPLGLTSGLRFGSALDAPPGLGDVDLIALPSFGSAGHAAGTCRPCAWFWKPQGCNNGQLCCHCHLCPAGEHKTRRAVRRVSQFTTLAAAADTTEDVATPPQEVPKWGAAAGTTSTGTGAAHIGKAAREGALRPPGHRLVM